MGKDLKEKLLVRDKWLRLLLMLFFVFIKHIISWIIVVISAFQFIFNLLFDKSQQRLLDFSGRLNVYFLQIVNFLTFNSETKPFPFADWPEKTKIEDYIK